MPEAWAELPPCGVRCVRASWGACMRLGCDTCVARVGREAQPGATMSGRARASAVNRLRHGGARHWAAPFVLAMLCLRAFVPAGFMLAPVDGRLAVVLCDTDALGAAQDHHAQGHYTPGYYAPDHHTPAHHAHDHTAGHHHAQTDPTCPYAQSSGPAPLPVLPVLAAVQLATLSAAPVQVAQTHSRFGPTRQQSPRGPPRLA
jgi:hypothetical protein